MLHRHVRTSNRSNAKMVAQELLSKPHLIDGHCIVELLFLADQMGDEKAIDSTLSLVRVAGIKLNIGIFIFNFEMKYI